ncbi:ataxin-10-like [Branchiostoma floridae x Branchiostoma belcheri]
MADENTSLGSLRSCVEVLNEYATKGELIVEVIGCRRLQENIEILTELLKSQENRTILPESVFQDASCLLEAVLQHLEASPPDGWSQGVLGTSTECFRFLRNSCVSCQANQLRVLNADLVPTTTAIVTLLAKQPELSNGSLEAADLVVQVSSSQMLALRCAVQLLGNLSSGNPSSQEVVWQAAYPDVFLSALGCPDPTAAGYCCMVLHVCLNDTTMQQLVLDTKGRLLVQTVLDLCERQPDLDWGVLLVTEKFLMSKFFLPNVYSTLPLETRIILLDIISAKIGESESSSPGEEEDQVLPVFVLEFLAAEFQENFQTILSVGENTENLEAVIIMKLLKVLCLGTGQQEKYMELIRMESLLASGVELLRLTTAAGKLGDNIFSQTQKMVPPDSPDDVHPVHGLKRDLIRLLGNMCFQNRSNQDKVRELEGIPLILDHCSIDDHNPYISQWAIFTIRNLCEGNHDNQAVIAGLENKGLADNIALNDFGIEVTEDEGKLVVKSADK